MSELNIFKATDVTGVIKAKLVNSNKFGWTSGPRSNARGNSIHSITVAEKGDNKEIISTEAVVDMMRWVIEKSEETLQEKMSATDATYSKRLETLGQKIEKNHKNISDSVASLLPQLEKSEVIQKLRDQNVSNQKRIEMLEGEIAALKEQVANLLGNGI